TYRLSRCLLLAHEDKTFQGALVASMSIPWGETKNDQDLGGYHLVWTRDLVQSASALLASGQTGTPLRALIWLAAIQRPDGSFPQNSWIDGTAYWSGLQLDQIAFSILLAWHLHKQDALGLFNPRVMIVRAAANLILQGPVTAQDRWEENAGYSTFTLAVEIAALLIAADYAELNNEPQVAIFLRETADSWNANIERWTYVTGSDLAKFVGVDGYYVRINAQETFDIEHGNGLLIIQNRPKGENICPASEMVSPDALALVRYGLRAADDPKILNTIKVIDATLKMEHPQYGPVWYRYNRDGYGEKANGQPYNGIGIGRPWPLLIGERAHYEVAVGNYAYAEKLLHTLENYANETGLFPEQVWDSDDIPELGLFFGKPSGSAMPLAWAHSEYIKLCRSLKAKKIFDMPQQVHQRYQVEKSASNIFIWNFSSRYKHIPKNKILRVQTLACATVKWTADNWETYSEVVTLDTGLGIFYADLATTGLSHDQEVSFTFHWHDSGTWENKNFSLTVEKNPDLKIAQQSEQAETPSRDKIKVFFPS
ncbi:MAG: glycoside hydrolase family 15 protein, partial [Bacteroidia bacterium]